MPDILHNRRSIRLEDYDYAQGGVYFVTLVTAGRVGRFGTITHGEMVLNPVGQMLLREWQRLPARFAGWGMDAFVIMPNHIHGILIHLPDHSIDPSAPVGAQRNEPGQGSSVNALRPDGDQPSTRVDSGDGGPICVGAQRNEPEQGSSLNALRPDDGQPSMGVDSGAGGPMRAQRGDSRSMPSLSSLRPYEEMGSDLAAADLSHGSVGAQRNEPEQGSSLNALRPDGGQPSMGVDSGAGGPIRAQRDDSRSISSGRAQHGDSRPTSSQVSLRPYEETCPYEETGNTRVDESPHVIPGSLGAVVRAFKSSTTLRYHSTRGADPGALWQRNYYEHIVRGPADMERICAYILTNPIQWELDRENPDRTSK